MAQSDPTAHTHSNIHTKQTACGYTMKYLKPILGARHYRIKCYVHPAPKCFYAIMRELIKGTCTQQIYTPINNFCGKMDKMGTGWTLFKASTETST